jgi:hypothetical protein
MQLMPSCRGTDLRSGSGEPARPVLPCEGLATVLVRMGLPDNEYAGHIGTATSATMAGVEVVDGKA